MNTMGKTLLTGGEGFIGNSIRDWWTHFHQSMVSADIRPKKGSEDIDILNPSSVGDSITKNSISSILHMVNYVDYKNPDKEREVMIDGLQNVLSVAADTGVEQVVVPVTREVFSKINGSEESKLVRICQHVADIRSIVDDFRDRLIVHTVTLPQVFGQTETQPVGGPKRVAELVQAIQNGNQGDFEVGGISIPYVSVSDVGEQIADEVIFGEFEKQSVDYGFEGIPVTPESIVTEADKRGYDTRGINIVPSPRVYEFKAPNIENMQNLNMQQVPDFNGFMDAYGLTQK